MPLISVVMPVHNGIRFLDESISSVLAQTFTDFELVIGDNGSTDGTAERLDQWQRHDSRIRLLRSDERLGPVGSSNWVVANARCDLIARMDADDIAKPRRLATQLGAMASIPDADLVGGLFDSIDEQGRPMRHPAIGRLFRQSPTPPFCHSTTMFRRRAFDAIGGYRLGAAYWEDMDLFWRFAATGKVFVCAEVLATLRHTSSGSRSPEKAHEVDVAVDRFYRSLAAYRGGGDPFALPPTQDPSCREAITPMAFASRAASMVWAGQRPRVAKRMLATADLRPSWTLCKALGFVLWATASPKTLRFCLLCWFNLRNMRPRRSEALAGLVRWLPQPQTVPPSGRERSAQR